ncbi:MAG: hypothetical protein K8J09_11425, partial [Planctomycetes bacterium]|nr:hypothetical protein [Planctomycetota bacterium]
MNLPADSCRGRPWRAAWRLLACLLPLALAVPGLGQRPPQRQLCNPVEFTTSQDDNLFSLVRSQEQIHLWQVALTELEAGDFAAAVQRLHGVMQADTGGVVPVSPGRFLGLRLAVVQTLANLPPAATAAYEDLVRREAGALADVDLTTLPPAQLERLAERFAPSQLGLAARLRLGDLAFEAGDGLTAAVTSAPPSTPPASAAATKPAWPNGCTSPACSTTRAPPAPPPGPNRCPPRWT